MMKTFEYLQVNESDLIKEYYKERTEKRKFIVFRSKDINKIRSEKLSELGAQGWELIDIVHNMFLIFGSGGSHYSSYLFKRTVSDE